MSKFTMTHALAVAEKARRQDNRARKAQGLKPRPAAHPQLVQLTGADLDDAIELLAPKAKATPAPARKRTQAQARAEFAAAAKARKGTGVGGPEHTAARAQAMLMHKAAKAAGEKLTYRDACIACGTLPAREMANA